MYHKCNVFKIINYRLEIYYTYNPTTTFGEFSEFLCSLYPKTFCPCFNFKYIEGDKCINLYNEIPIKSCEDYIKNLKFKKDNPHCECKQESKEYLKYSKIELYNQKIVIEKKLRELVGIIDNLKSENIILNDKNNKLKNFLEKKEYNIQETTKEIQIENKISGDFKIDKDGRIKTYEKSGEIKSTDFYDVIVCINSIKEITKGWEVKMSKRALDKYEEFKKGNVVKIGVIGNSNKGKSFLLSKISGIKLPFGTSIRTEGLSIKYPQIDVYSNRNIALLDSAGLETPVLKGEEKILEENNIEEEKINIIKNEKELFKEKCRDKIITELFLQNYIINYSDILIIVVGVLTYSEQKLLNKIKNEIKKAKLNKTLYVIHNLKTYTTIKQVEDYIKDILLKNATFDLQKQQKISTKINDNKGEIYYEKNSDISSYHLIFANEDSEAGDYYNKYTLEFIEDTYKFLKDFGPFDVIETVKDRFKQLSKDIIEKPEKELQFDNSDNLDIKSIKLYQPENIILKLCSIDELGFSNFKSNGFEPNYNYYIKDDQIIVRVEAPGNSTIESSLKHIGEYTTIKLNGSKSKDKEPEELEQNIFNSREIGTFSLDIPLKTEEYLIKNELPKIEKKNGIFILSFKLEEKLNKIIRYNSNQEDEI